MFDYHVHSHFSADCDIQMEKMIQNALKKGIMEICFTDHIDFDYPDPDFIFEFDLQTYDQHIHQMREHYGQEIAIKKGVEIGIQPHLIDRYNEVLNEESFDFIICSMHSTAGYDLHSGKFFEGKTLNEAYETYYTELYYCIKSFKNYSVLGHLDLVKRYRYDQNVHHFLEVIEEILKTVITDGKGIEVNTSGYRSGLESGMPDMDILRLYKDLNGEIITIGSDSHTPDTLGYGYQKTVEQLKDIGFTYITTYEKQKPIFHKL
ncbi:histidinol-phosphatase (PHP family) [Melghiribacillus thermohalophilus]|uniref:Histidinol-phosphatase n=1 Tax=Melghiribacillus thermohalophilus TaxID=1324956 RepID=A0A4R3NA22_9BACI|nr:histidinol-phosphatase HisJ family protein [Melghiribacillus thermohalophilus]TCT25490.1 histidinol-phosphatase (PHP family) [Melghiribacillus thermohalophilus]